MDLSNWKVNSAVQTVDNGQVTPALTEACQSFLGRAGQCMKRAMATAAIAGAVMAGGHAQAAVEAPTAAADPYSEAAMLQSAIAGSAEQHSLEMLRLKAEQGDVEAATSYVEIMRSHLTAQHEGGLITDAEMDTYNAEFDQLIEEGEPACMVAAAKATAARYDITERPIGATLNGALAVLTGGISVGVHAASDSANSCIENDKLRKGVSGAISLAAMAQGDVTGAASIKNMQMVNGMANHFIQHDTKLGDNLMSAASRDTAPSGSLDIDAMATDQQASADIKTSSGLKF
jgi:hypothetical protein